MSLYIPIAYNYQEPPTEGTVKPHSPFNAETDAGVLRKAMKGFGEYIIILKLINVK